MLSCQVGFLFIFIIILEMSSKHIVAIVALIAVAAVLLGRQSEKKHSDFESWKAQHSISYDSEIENTYRMGVFLKNLQEIESHNSNKDNSHKLGLTRFSALTPEEFAQAYLTLRAPEIFKVVEP